MGPLCDAKREGWDLICYNPSWFQDYVIQGPYIPTASLLALKFVPVTCTWYEQYMHRELIAGGPHGKWDALIDSLVLASSAP